MPTKYHQNISKVMIEIEHTSFCLVTLLTDGSTDKRQADCYITGTLGVGEGG